MYKLNMLHEMMNSCFNNTSICLGIFNVHAIGALDTLIIVSI